MKEIIQNITAIIIPIVAVGAFWNDVIIPISELYTYSLPILLILMLSIFLLWILTVKLKKNQNNINMKRIKLIEKCLTGTIILTVLCIFSFWINDTNYLITKKSKILGKEISNDMFSKNHPSINLAQSPERSNKTDNLHKLRNESETERRKQKESLREDYKLGLIDSSEYINEKRKIERRFDSIISL